MAAFFLLGASAYLLKAYVAETPDELAAHRACRAPGPTTLFGVVTECPPATEGSRLTFIVDVDGVETQGERSSVSGRTRVNWYRPSGCIEPGDVVEVTGRLKPLTGFKNPHTFDYERYMHRRGIFTRMQARGPESVIVRSKGGLGWPARLREFFRRRGLEIISSSTRTDETRAFLSAILLGERGLLTREMKDWFKRTGTFHVLAISGLHVGLVYLIASLALTPLSLGARTRVALAILVVWLYAFATGGRVPVTRASIMLTLVLAEYYLSREGDFLTAVAFAALVIVGLNPLVIDEASFQLSFTAVLLLCTFEPLFSDRIYPAVRQRLQRIPSPILHKLALTLFASFVLGIGMLPLVAYHFNLVSLVFPIANLVVVPILSLVLASGFACLLVGFLWIKAAAVFGLAAEAFAWTIFATVKLCSLLPASSMRVGSPPVWTFGLGAVGITLVWWRGRLSRKLTIFAAVAGVLVATAFAGNRLSGNVLRATFLDVGDADSCLIEFPGGETMLVDTGFAAPSFDCGEQVVAPFLWRQGITKIGALVLTHPDSDHIGGALFLAKNFKIDRLFVADLAETPPEYSEILRVADERGFRVEAVGAGDVIPGIENVRVEVLNPPREVSRSIFSDNETSVVLRVTYGETSLLLTGDAEKRALRLLTDLGEKIGSRILKAPHHGLANSFSKRFVKTVGPEMVVISGRPYRIHESIEDRTARYAPLCGRVLSTQDSGGITIESDGRSLKTVTTRKQPAELF